ncbi:Pectinesterase [Handroanthus impetiginosus]|uniref:Pectinesterase n=1 Tax=Handroanthus impetiginosus TaxID=429701 RepID=A0A2G9FY80_9LAMI|nr:Pectinesterase [Handroanthus impetiginosus]
MSSTNQPLLHTPHKTTTNCKILFITISISTLLISAVLLLPNLTNKSSHNYLSNPSSLCLRASNPQACQDFVSEVVSDEEIPLETTTLFRKILIKQAHHMNRAILQTRKLKSQINAHNEEGALADCLELIDLSIDLVFDSIKALGKNQTSKSNANAQAWLSGVLTNHVSCLDGLNSVARKSLGAVLEELISRAKASLGILAAISEQDVEMTQPLRGKLPSWITAFDRKLMQSRADAIKADIVVAKDGSGNYKTVAEAIAAAPNKSKTRFVIHVKKGTYKENVEVGKSKRNVMIIGDGMDATILTGDLNVVDGSTTFRSATLAAVGEGVILQDIWIQNTAGPEKHQAVALRVGADKSVINRCRIDAYQDTLYAHSLRQFYRDCYITGTVDFIFGNAAVVFQKCNLVPRKPMQSQKNMVTAQGRTDPNQSTGTSIQDCEIKASSDLEAVKSSFPTYLGRPWKEYSRTVVMQSYIGDVIEPAGWSEWSGDFALKTLYYGEYMNRGPGAGTSKRVKWPGYHIITSAAEAMKFTVRELIQGGEWLGSTGVAYTEGL